MSSRRRNRRRRRVGTPRATAYKNPLTLKFDAAFFSQLPTQAGVYFFLDSNLAPLYIGKANHLKKRLLSYRNAKPETTPDHTLEMLDLVAHLRWEIHPTGADALKRESELIRAVRPPYNIAGTYPIHYLYWGVRYPLPSPGTNIGTRTNTGTSAIANANTGIQPVDFRLSHRLIKEGYQVYGCFKYRKKVKAGYTALLRLLFAAVCRKDRFHFPARICHESPPYSYQAKIPRSWEKPLDDFLSGQNSDLLQMITFQLLEKENIPRFMVPALQTDIETVLDFFKSGPQETRQVALKLGIKKPFVSQRRMNRFIMGPLGYLHFQSAD